MTTLRDLVSRLLFDPAFRDGDAETALYRRLHAEAPILRADRIWVVAGWNEITGLISDPRCAIDPRAAEPPLPVAQSDLLDAAFGRMLNLRDGADHSRLRALAMAAFTAYRTNAVRPLVTAVVAELVDRAVERAAAEGEVDVIAEIGVPLPVATSCAMLGLPRSDWPRVTAWARLLSGQISRFGQSAAEVAAVESEVGVLIGYIDELCAQRRRHPGDDLISKLVDVARDADRLSREELVAYVMLLFMNGLDTMTLAIGNVLWVLAHRPALLGHLRDHPADAEAVYEEALRLESPVRLGGRRLTGDVDYAGHRLRRDDLVMFLWAAANRDPRRFERPDVYDIHRPGRRHMAFGWGVHHCLGAPLSVVQAGALLRHLAQRCATIGTDATPATAGWRANVAFHGFDELRVRLEPVPARALEGV